ncbi:hypothetical protein PMAYCL1PPCAC_09447, partial [Pristionchus mayeri]
CYISFTFRWPVIHLGTWAAGGSVVGARETSKLHEYAYQLQDSCPSVVLVTEISMDVVIEVVKQCPSVKMIVCVRSSEEPLPLDVIDYEETLMLEPLREIVQVSPDSECMIFYSSGTTGMPKGVIHTHRTFHTALEMMNIHWLHELYPVLLGGIPVDLREESQVVAFPCYHTSGFFMLNLSMLTGTPIVLMKTFDGDVYLNAIEKFKPRQLGISPPIFAYLAKRKAPLFSVEMITCGTAPLTQEICNEFRAIHPNVKYIVQAYGMTENIATHLPLLLEEGINASAGIIASGFEQKIVDPQTHKLCEQGQRGELWVRGPTRAVGYLNNEKATREFIDEEGWMHTGDIAYIDQRGLLYIVDRMKEMIKVNYKNQSLQVGPAIIEGVLLSHHKIQDVAVVGVTTDQSGGELIRAFVVKADETLTSAEVEGIVAETLEEYLHITGGVFFIDAIPRAPTGKILRRALKEITTA